MAGRLQLLWEEQFAMTNPANIHTAFLAFSLLFWSLFELLYIWIKLFPQMAGCCFQQTSYYKLNNALSAQEMHTKLATS